MVLRWIAANTLAWSLACGIVLRFARFPYIFEHDSSWRKCVLTGISCGLIVGVAQWLALRRRLALSPGWIAGACLGWVVWDWTWRANPPNLAFIALLVTGALLAAGIQLPLLWARTARPALWLLAAASSGFAAWYVAVRVGVAIYGYMGDEAIIIYFVGGAAGGLASGSISAPFLAWMLRGRPGPVGDAAPNNPGLVSNT